MFQMMTCWRRCGSIDGSYKTYAQNEDGKKVILRTIIPKFRKGLSQPIVWLLIQIKISKLHKKFVKGFTLSAKTTEIDTLFFEYSNQRKRQYFVRFQ
jgi:hypothetical protein